MATIVPASLGQFGDLVDESIQNVFNMRAEVLRQMEQIFNVETTSSYYDKDSSTIGGGRARFTGENASVVYDAPIQGFDKTYTQKKYTYGDKFTEHVWKFGFEARKLTDFVGGMMDAVDNNIETCAFGMLDNGWSTSYTDGDQQTVSTAGGDSVAYFSASHTREDGGTAWNNVVYDGTTYNMDWEYDSMKAARKTATAILDGKGLPLGINLDTLVCKQGSSVQDRYEELMGAISRNYIPGGNENDGAAKVGLPKLITSKYLANDLYWWAFDSSKKNARFGLQWRWSEKPNLLPAYLDYDTQEYRRQVKYFAERGANNMRSWVGSTGANA